MFFSSNVLDYKIIDTRIGNHEGGIPLPTYGSDGAAGLDLRACVEKETYLHPGEAILIPTGIAVHIANPDFAGLLLPRSGLGHKHGVVLGNLVGLIDSDYQGELKVSAWNRSKKMYTIEVGEKLAQMILVPVVQATLREVLSLDTTERGEGGFGSTGKQ